MPIYAYRCAACGHAKDVLQKVSDPVLTVCPACGASAFQKQVTAAGFQLKGSGWYVTDFRDGGSAANKTANGSSKGGDAEKAVDGAAKTADAGGGKSAGGDSSGSSSAPAPAPAASTTPSAPAGDAN
ncbi:MAG TPA: FmdB family zinc ribbon protein [Burkholderiaceae bacterium]